MQKTILRIYLALLQDKWKDTYPEITEDTAILATPYNIGEDGGENGINSNPEPNPFGEYAGENYDYMNELLGLN